MEDKPRRAILSLKAAPKFKLQPSLKALAIKDFEWRCKPCGALVKIDPEWADADFVRCPSCTAKLGRAADFRVATPEEAKVRARLVKAGKD